MVAIPLVNLSAVIVEVVIGFFFSGFTLGRIKRSNERSNATSFTEKISVTFLVLVCLVLGGLVVPKLIYRSVTLIAKDGHSLPYAALIIHTGSGDHLTRTDSSGRVEISRFTTHSITIKDPRYVERTWLKSELQGPLTVERTLLGSGLDSVMGKVLNPSK
jgi:hypothetical protein